MGRQHAHARARALTHTHTREKEIVARIVAIYQQTLSRSALDKTSSKAGKPIANFCWIFGRVRSLLSIIHIAGFLVERRGWCLFSLKSLVYRLLCGCTTINTMIHYAKYCSGVYIESTTQTPRNGDAPRGFVGKREGESFYFGCTNLDQ